MGLRYTQTTLKKRVRAFLLCIFCILFALTGRLVYIQLFTGSALRALAAEQWYRDLPLMAKRGNIYDRNGVLMAQNTLTYSVYVRPVAVTEPERAASVLAANLGLTYETVLAKVQNRGASEHLVQMQVEKPVAMKIIAENVGGILISQTYRRDYPLGAVGGQVLGLASVDNQGQSGLEVYYDKYLRGIDGRAAVESDLRGKPIKNGTEFYTPSTDGYDLRLNVDAAIQKILQDIVQTAYEDQGAKNVSALIMDIDSGGVIASGAAPFYDMNNQPRDNAAELLGQIKNLPMLNVLEPGSTFKIITLAAAIEEGVVSENDRFNCPGYRIIDGERVKCWRTRGHGVQTLAEGVCHSCNCVFMDLALRLGTDKYYEYLKKFGIGQKTGVDSFAEPGGLLLDKKWVRNVDLARIGFGQAIAISPVQFQTVVGAIVGDGTLKTPRIAKSINGLTDAVTAPDRGKILSENTCTRVKDLLYGVVNQGSGKHAGRAGYAIGGKTGTAQKYKDGIIDQGKYISSFIGFLSVDGKAKYSAYIMVDEPSKMGYYGSLVAAPYVGQMFEKMIEYLEIPPNPDIPGPFIPDYLNPPAKPEPLVELPSVEGLPLFEAIGKLQALKFFVETDGDGDTAIGTFPAKGSMLKSGEPVVIIT
jgi:stage V sporulation protein D (sporulation-specific penicillin-binding protein)